MPRTVKAAVKMIRVTHIQALGDSQTLLPVRRIRSIEALTIGSLILLDHDEQMRVRESIEDIALKLDND